MKRLDWTRLLGFEQVAGQRETTSEKHTRVGGKVGQKDGRKFAMLPRIGVKEGIKPLN